MEKTILEIINNIRAARNKSQISELHPDDKLREDLDLTSFDLAELTVFGVDVFEDGLVNTVGEIYAKLTK